MSSTHDILAYAVATEAIRRTRVGAQPWHAFLSAQSYLTASRRWPVPDFVLHDPGSDVMVAAEFKPPQQTKREYLTGLGQAVAYTRDFNYGLLILPTIADDGYPIADHVTEILNQKSMDSVPVGLLSYDPALLSPANPTFSEAVFFKGAHVPSSPVRLDQSFYAKWREQSPEELYFTLKFSYQEVGIQSGRTIRDRAFDHLWALTQAGGVKNWAGSVRNYAATDKMKVAVAKNYRNFAFHIGWTDPDGTLTRDGLEAWHIGTLYGPWSLPFLDALSRAVLIDGKHLILFNAINEYQDSLGVVPAEGEWLDGLELFLQNKGLLKRNEQRGAAAVKGSKRQFLKAEKQLWKNLGLIIPYGQAKKLVYHPGRGLIFDWARITALLKS